MKTDKYIVLKPKPNEAAEFAQGLPPENIRKRVLYLDNEVVDGAFYVATSWFYDATGPGPQAHTHPFPEVLAFFGTNPDDPYDLCGEVEFWLEDEKHILTNSFIAYIPAGMKHCPLEVLRADRPMFHFTTGPQGMYGGKLQ